MEETGVDVAEMKLKSRWLSRAEGEEEESQPTKEEAQSTKDLTSDFEQILGSVYLCSESGGGRQKGGSMRCECREEEEGEEACGSECLNRLLYIECRAKCSGGRCGNQRMRRGQNAAVEVFDAGAKGRGLRALQRLKEDDFIMEYVGEVVNHTQMSRRLKRYSRDSAHKHHYCMALKNDLIIDATNKGSISRFINHSCAPNAATQKVSNCFHRISLANSSGMQRRQ